MHHEKRSSSRLASSGSPVTACLGACSSKQTVSDFVALRESRPPWLLFFVALRDPFAQESKPTY